MLGTQGTHLQEIQTKVKCLYGAYLEKKQFAWRRKSQINMDEIWWSNYQKKLNQKQKEMYQKEMEKVAGKTHLEEAAMKQLPWKRDRDRKSVV